MAAPLIVVGLGNPGTAYKGSLHNLGRCWVEDLAKALASPLKPSKRFAGQVAKARYRNLPCTLYLPDSWMNESGPPVAGIVRRLYGEPEKMLVIHDEMDLPAGQARLKFGGGDAGHNGLRSLRQHLGGDYWRLRLGIGHSEGERSGRDFVLSRPHPEQKQQIASASQRSLELFLSCFGQTWEEMVRQLHSPPTT